MSTLRLLDKKSIIRNKCARRDYDIKKLFTAGIVLKGYEAKSIMSGNMNLKDSFVKVEKGEVWLRNAYIAKWKFSNIQYYDSRARRKLLLNRREIEQLEAAQNAKKMSIVPLSVFLKDRKLKVKIGVGKGRKKYDKRAKIKEREIARQMREEVALIEK